MNIKKIMFCLCAASVIGVSAQQINPVTQAVLDSYQTILAENPKDYVTLFQRGAQYYNLSMLDKALSDLEKAVKLTPEKEKDMRFQEYSLLSSIYAAQKNYNLALSAADSGLAINPESYPLLYAKGNICLELKDTQGASACFRRMQGIKSRSQEALFGLARVAVLENRPTDAQALMKEAENLDPSSYITFCRLGDINRELGDNQLAAANYLSAFALSSGQERPLESLIDLASTDYPSVESAIDYAISKTSNTVPLTVLKANTALYSGNYDAAYNAFNELVAREDGRESAVYAALASSCIALDKPDEALNAASIAVTANPSAQNYLIKAEAERIAGNYATALIDAEKAYKADINSTSALREMALNNMGNGNNELALANLNEAILTDPADTEIILLRAYLYSDKLKDNKSALADYKRVMNSPTSDFKSVVRKALATTLAGDKKSGDMIIAENIRDAKAADDYFMAAIYYSQAGDLQKGKDMLDRAKALGYQNLYRLNRDKTANLNIAPIRHL